MLKNRMYGNWLFLNIKHINHATLIFQEMTWLYTFTARPPRQHAGAYILSCSFSVVKGDMIWIFSWILSSLFWSVCQKNAYNLTWVDVQVNQNTTSHIENWLSVVSAFSSSINAHTRGEFAWIDNLFAMKSNYNLDLCCRETKDCNLQQLLSSTCLYGWKWFIKSDQIFTHVYRLRTIMGNHRTRADF